MRDHFLPPAAETENLAETPLGAGLAENHQKKSDGEYTKALARPSNVAIPKNYEYRAGVPVFC